MATAELPDPLAPPEGYGAGPATLAGIAHGAGDGLCDVRQPGLPPPFPPTRCARPAVVRQYIGCPNEHVGFVDLCPSHKDAVNPFTTCGRCKDAGVTSRIAAIKTEALP